MTHSFGEFIEVKPWKPLMNKKQLLAQLIVVSDELAEKTNQHAALNSAFDELWTRLHAAERKLKNNQHIERRGEQADYCVGPGSIDKRKQRRLAHRFADNYWDEFDIAHIGVERQDLYLEHRESWATAVLNWLSVNGYDVVRKKAAKKRAPTTREAE